MDTTPHISGLRSEVTFAAASVALAIGIGALGPSHKIQVYVLFVVWAGLVGLMIPRLLRAQQIANELAAARQREQCQQVLNHDMASALLTIEGGIAALRHVCSDRSGAAATAPTTGLVGLESIAHAIEAEIGRMRRISSSTLACHVDSCVETTVHPLVALHVASGTDISADLASGLRVIMSSDDLARVVSNVLDNCIRHAPGASILVSGRAVKDRYQLRISDSGPGIPIDLVAQAFDRGASCRDDGGLGLFSARSIVERYAGTISIDASCAGTSVIVDLPAPATGVGASHCQPRSRSIERV